MANLIPPNWPNSYILGSPVWTMLYITTAQHLETVFFNSGDPFAIGDVAKRAEENDFTTGPVSLLVSTVLAGV